MADAGEAFTIVLGFDGSDAARRGVADVGRFATSTKTVVVVAVTPEVRSSSISHEPLAGGDFDADRLLEEAAELLSGMEGATVERRAATGDPAAVLVEVARDVDADLLIVGRRGSNFVSRTLLGSVAERVIQQARCDVLVVS
jgi:nucleotide-binding universal stress UspA family protein